MPFHDRMMREAERQDADAYQREALEQNAQAALRCPIAAAFAAELAELIWPEYDMQRYGERWSLLAAAERVCQAAVLQGRDLPLKGLAPIAWNADAPWMPQDFSDAWDLATVTRYAREELA